MGRHVCITSFPFLKKEWLYMPYHDELLLLIARLLLGLHMNSIIYACVTDDRHHGMHY